MSSEKPPVESGNGPPDLTPSVELPPGANPISEKIITIRFSDATLAIRRVDYEIDNQPQNRSACRLVGQVRLPELVDALVQRIETFCAQTAATCERTESGDLQPLGSGYSLYQLWVDVEELSFVLLRAIIKMNLIEFVQGSPPSNAVCPIRGPDGKCVDYEPFDDPGFMETCRQNDEARRALGMRAPPQGAIPADGFGRDLQAVLGSFMYPPMKKGVVKVAAVERLRGAAAELRRLFHLPRTRGIVPLGDERGMAAGGGGPVAQGDDDAGMFTVADLAARFGVEAEPLRKRLDRWREAHAASGDWTENEGATSRKAKYRYRLGAIREVITSGRASGKRPPKKQRP